VGSDWKEQSPYSIQRMRGMNLVLSARSLSLTYN